MHPQDPVTASLHRTSLLRPSEENTNDTTKAISGRFPRVKLTLPLRRLPSFVKMPLLPGIPAPVAETLFRPLGDDASTARLRLPRVRIQRHRKHERQRKALLSTWLTRELYSVVRGGT